MFNQLRYIFLVFFIELILLGQVLSEQVITTPQTFSFSSFIDKTHQAVFTETLLEKIPDFYEAVEQVETSQEENEKKRILSCDIHIVNAGLYVVLKRNYQSVYNVFTSVRRLRLFLLYHCWKIHFIV